MIAFAWKTRIKSKITWPFVRAVTVQLVGLGGVAAVIEGIREIYSPVALIAGGGAVVVWTIMKVRSTE